VHFANRDPGFSVCLSLPGGCGIGELRPPSPTQCAEALRETSAEVDVKYMVRRQPPSQTWRAFLNNHVKTLVSVDFFTVPTIGFRVLYVFLVWLMNAVARSTST
jgi:hypothetical protein